MEYQHAKGRPWIFRTYAGHSTAKNLMSFIVPILHVVRPGFSVAFDLPTQTALDSDHVLSKGEVGSRCSNLPYWRYAHPLLTGLIWGL